MELNEMLEYAHGFVLKSSEGLAENGRNEEPTCGVWTVRDVIGHLCSFKLYVADVLSTFKGNTDTPYFNLMAELRGDFGDAQVAARRDISFEDNLAEYNAVHARMPSLLAQIPGQDLHRPGSLPCALVRRSIRFGRFYSLHRFRPRDRTRLATGHNPEQVTCC